MIPEGKHKVPNDLMQFFAFEHLDEYLQLASKPFYDLAYMMDHVLPDNAEKTAAFRKLLEARDGAIRALQFNPVAPPTT
jgi:hypothetical protein